MSELRERLAEAAFEALDVSDLHPAIPVAMEDRIADALLPVVEQEIAKAVGVYDEERAKVWRSEEAERIAQTIEALVFDIDAHDGYTEAVRDAAHTARGGTA